MLLEPGYSPSELEGEISVALGEIPQLRRLSSSISAAATLDFEQIAEARRQIIEAQNQEIRRLRQRILALSQELKSSKEGDPEEPSEILDLPPLSKRRVNVKVRKREPARFRFVENGEEADSDDTEE